MASGTDQRIKVGIRVRKLTRKEKDKNQQLQWKYSDNQVWQIDPQNGKKTGNPYTFDYVFGMDSSSQNIFEDLVLPIVESSVKGFNGTIFAYGQTSSGKTYTMMGEKSEAGIIPLSVNHVFNSTEKDSEREYLIRVSYMEIYNEKIHDLLESQNNLRIHEDASGNAYVLLKEEIVDCPEKVMAVMKKGEKMRRVGVTDINERSSRSHTIFRITIESRRNQTDLNSSGTYWDDAVHVSHLNLIDLAGSERVVQTKATGDRFKEGCAINKSLFHLGKVISQLSEGRGQYVNFRDSKLTRILESSLGGNAHTAIICTVTPASVEETASTLCFASRAIRVTNTPHLNEIVSDECLLRRHAAEVKKLEMELEKAKQDNDCESMKKELEQKEKIICRLKDWIKRDKLQVFSPRTESRSERRKTWAASDLTASLLRAKVLQQEDLTALNEEDFGSGSIGFDSPTLDNVFECEKTDFVRRDRGSSGLWNKENHPLQHVCFSWQSPMSKSCGKEPKRGSQGRGKKRKSTMGERESFEFSFSKGESLEEEISKFEFLESSLEKKTQELEDMALKEKELLFRMGESERSALNDKRVLMSVIEDMLEVEQEKNKSEMDSLFKAKYYEEVANNMEKKLEEKDAIIQLLTSQNYELNAALHSEKLRADESDTQLKAALERVNTISMDLSAFTKLSNFTQEAVSAGPTVESENVTSSKNALQKLTEVVAGMKSFFVGEIREIIKEAEGLSNLSMKMEEEISTMKMQFENILRESDKLKAERIEFQSHLNKERETVICLQDQLQSSDESRIAMSHQVNGLLEQLKKTEGDLLGLMEKNKRAESEIVEHAKHFQELEEEIEASEVVIANLAEFDEENLVELKELTHQNDRLKEQLFGANEKVALLLSEIQVMKEDSVPRELLDSMESEVQRLTSGCEILENQLSEMKGVCVELEKKNAQLSEEKAIVIKEREKVITECEEVRSANSRGFNELTLVQEALNEAKCELSKLTEENKRRALSEANEKSLGEEESLKLISDISQLTALNEQLTQKLNETSEKLSNEEKSFVARECVLKSKMEEMEVHLGEKSAEVDLLSSKISELDLLLNSKDEQMNELESKVMELNEKLILHINEVNVGKNRISELEADLVAAQSKLTYETAHIREESEELMKERLQEMSLALQHSEEKLKLSSEEATAEREKHNEVTTGLEKQLEDLSAEFEVISNQKDETIQSLKHELQVEVEKYILKCQELESMVAIKSDIEAKLEDIYTEKEKLCSELQMANEKMMLLKKDAEEFEAEKSHYEQRCGDLQKQLQDASHEFEMTLKENDEKVDSLRHELQVEMEKFIQKSEEADLLRSMKDSGEAQLKEILVEKDKLLAKLESAEKSNESIKSEMAAELEMEKNRHEQRIAALEKQLEDAHNDFKVHLKEKDEKVSSLQHELQIETEKFNQKKEEADSLVLMTDGLKDKLQEMSLAVQHSEEKLKLISEECEVLGKQLSDMKGVCVELERKNTQLIQEMNILTEERDKIITESEEVRSANSRGFNELMLVQEALKEAKCELNNLAEENKGLVLSLTTEKNNNDIMQSNMEKIVQEKESLLKQLEEIRQVSCEESNRLEVISSLQKELEEVKFSLSVCADSEKELDSLLSSEKEKIIILNNKLSMTSAEKEELTLKVQQLQHSVEELDNNLRLSEEKSLKLVNDISQLTALNEQLTQELNETSEKFSNEEKSFVARECALKSKMEEIEGHLGEKSAEVDLLNSKNTELNLLLNSKDEQMNELESKVMELNEKLILHINEVNVGKNRISELEADLVAAQSKLTYETAHIREESEELMKERLQEMSLALQHSEEKLKLSSEEATAEREKHNEVTTGLEKQLEDLGAEFEVISNQKDETIQSLKHELQVEVEKYILKCQELESMLAIKSDIEAKLEDISTEKEKLCSELQMTNEKMMLLKKDAEEFETERSHYEQRCGDLQKQLQDASHEFEITLKEKDEKMDSLRHELQVEMEKYILKCQELESMLAIKSDIEAKLEDIYTEKEKLCSELQMTNEKMMLLKKDAEEFEAEKSHYEQRYGDLQKQLQNACNEFEITLKENDEKVDSLRHELQVEMEKYIQKSEEADLLRSMKDSGEAQLKEILVEKDKLLAKLESAEKSNKSIKSEMAAELEMEKNRHEQRIAALEKQLEDAHNDFKVHLKEKDEKVSSLQHELQIETEKFNQKKEEANSLMLMKDGLKDKLQEITNSREQLSVLLNIEKEGRLAAQAARDKTLEVIDSQQKVMAVLETSISDLQEKLKSENENCTHLKIKCSDLEQKLADKESSANAELSCLLQQKKMLEDEVKGLRDVQLQQPSDDMLNDLKEKDRLLKVFEQKMEEALKDRAVLETEVARSKAECRTLETHLSQIQGQLQNLHDAINAKQEEMNELQERYNERDDYAKRMDKWAVKMEKRVTTADDYRIEIQQKAKAMETELKLKINQLKAEKERLEHQKMNPEPVKCNCQQKERELRQEREEKEALKQKVEEYNRIITCGGRFESTHSKKPVMNDMSVQTASSIEVVDIDPSGCGVVQVCKVDVLNQMVNKLKKEKEDLKQICRRRHNQREELKFQVEELKIKLKTLESQASKN
ncbi:centromere-associated protein E-like [Ischnura elegans]|uniref:centromere-associated protein E-like n=1 Tax=Ischnura elegans TaxID=197161 RepID=UPI001ED8A9D2|nr:centromere-associated protein E-like [Ischnura elegans]